MMNINLKYYLLIQLLFMSMILHAQKYEQLSDKAFREAEELLLVTDRNIYAVNENINFRCFYKKQGEIPADEWSKVIYLELISPQGQTLSKGKFPNNSRGSAGNLQIPPDILTGNYYLKAYTKWMRNYGPASFAYVPLKIINPFNKEILKVEDFPDSEGVDSIATIDEFKEVAIIPSKKTFAKGEEVSLNFTMNSLQADEDDDFCISVIASGLADTSFLFTEGDPGSREEFSFGYLPDIRGVSISGKVLSKNGEPLSSAKVHFALLGDQYDYFVGTTDQEGRFIINLPDRPGINELFIASEPQNETQAEIMIDQDFSPENAAPGVNEFTLSPYEKKAATSVVVNMQLRRAFENSPPENALSPSEEEHMPFYCNPDVHVDVREFVQLPTMTEVFNNIVSGVTVRKKDGQPYLEVAGENRSIGQFSPLVLIDNIPVFDLKDVLNIHPTKIKTIDVVNEVYLLGNTRFGGIIHLTTRKGDMGAVELPEGSFFLDYTGYHPSGMNHGQPAGGARIPGGEKEGDRIPDMRNTIFWSDHKPVGNGEIRFVAPGNAGKYVVLVRGMNKDGEYVYGKSSFIVE